MEPAGCSAILNSMSGVITAAVPVLRGIPSVTACASRQTTIPSTAGVAGSGAGPTRSVTRGTVSACHHTEYPVGDMDLSAAACAKILHLTYSTVVPADTYAVGMQRSMNPGVTMESACLSAKTASGQIPIQTGTIAVDAGTIVQNGQTASKGNV